MTSCSTSDMQLALFQSLKKLCHQMSDHVLVPVALVLWSGRMEAEMGEDG